MTEETEPTSPISRSRMSRGTGSPPPMAGGRIFLRTWRCWSRLRDLASVKESLYELTTNMEHQGTLWHATPFGMVFLSRILGKALKESGRNPVAHFLAGELLDFFSCILQCFHDGDEMEHAEALPLFSDLLKEEYLWSEEYDEEEDEMRYEEDEVFPDDLFYSFYYYSWQAVLAYRDILEQVSEEFAGPAAAVLKLL